MSAGVPYTNVKPNRELVEKATVIHAKLHDKILKQVDIVETALAFYIENAASLKRKKAV